MPVTPNRHPSPGARARRILVRGVNWLGDAVMTTPALMRLREAFPEAHIALLTPDKLAGLWSHHPAVNEIIAFDAGEGVLSTSRRLRAGRFDLALVLPNSPRSALETWLARIPQRVGYARPWRSLFLTTRVPRRTDAVKMRKRSVGEIKRLVSRDTDHGSRPTPPASAHQIHEYLHLAATLGADSSPLAPKLFLTTDEQASFQNRFLDTDQSKVDGSAPLWCGLNAGAEYGPAKRWPVERFIAAANEVSRRTGCHWLILGGRSDASIAEQVAAGVSSFTNLCGRTTLRELMTALWFCRVLLTNDSGPMHVAAALGTPVVVPFGSTSPELTGPGLPGDSRQQLLKPAAPCAPCFLRICPIDFRCMTGITVERVVAAVLQAGFPSPVR